MFLLEIGFSICGFWVSLVGFWFTLIRDFRKGENRIYFVLSYSDYKGDIFSCCRIFKLSNIDRYIDD